MGELPNEREDRDHDLVAFATRLRHQHVRFACKDAMLRAGLAVAVPCALAAWLVAAWRWPLALGVAAFASLAGLAAAVRARRVADTALLRVADVDAIDDPRLLAELTDELATWLEVRRASPSAMRDWLARDVQKKLPALGPGTVAAIGRRRLGNLAWLLPMLVLLLLAWWLTNLLSPPWPGVLGGRRQTQSSGGGGSGEGGRGEGGGKSSRPEQPDPQKKDAPDRHGEVPPPPAHEDKPEPPKPEEPAPLLDLPSQQRFIVPEFVGDGPTRRARVHAAEVEQGAPAGSSAQRSGETRPLDLPPPTPEQFARAAEAALAARHVPPAEQPMVRRFFDGLQKAAK